jgi:hypothetical protein
MEASRGTLILLYSGRKGGATVLISGEAGDRLLQAADKATFVLPRSGATRNREQTANDGAQIVRAT